MLEDDDGSQEKTGKTIKRVTNINTGIFKFDIKFENKYELKVSIDDKEYFSKEVYFRFEDGIKNSYEDFVNDSRL